jgi:AraC-like DNA-binding protein
MTGTHSTAPVSHRLAEILATRLREPWSVPRLARALGVSSRSLHRVIRRDIGVSPMQLVRQGRLAMAREELQTPGEDVTVTEVALDCGFSHLGRFSAEYARRFGETPSQTLRRARYGLPGEVPAVFSQTVPGTLLEW